jgi:hypothetical protein
MGGREYLAGPGSIAGVIRELYCIDRPDIVAEALKRKDGHAIPDMTVGYVGLNRKDCHSMPPK